MDSLSKPQFGVTSAEYNFPSNIYISIFLLTVHDGPTNRNDPASVICGQLRTAGTMTLPETAKKLDIVFNTCYNCSHMS